MTIGERIKHIRKENKLSQVEFAGILKISGQAVSKLESGTNNPSDQTISLICREFGIREEWLRHGEEPMMEEKPRDKALATELEKILTAGPDDFRRKMIAVLVQMPPDWWCLLESKAQELLMDTSATAPTKGKKEEVSAGDRFSEHHEEENLSEEGEQEGKIPAVSLTTAIRNGQDIIRGMTRAEYHARLDQQLDAEQEEDRKRIQVLPQSGKDVSGNDSPARGSASTGTGGGVA